ncbi:MAG: cobyrinate a,c-diamide synthase [Limnospira sp.]
MTVIIAGERSGVGKTTLTLCLLAYLKSRQFDVQSFKVGPDYIDPMFHEYVTGKPCRNLDPILTSEDYVRRCFSRHVRRGQYGLIEGVMGLFDGLPVGGGKVPIASTAHVAELLDLPIILAIDCARLSGSAAAIVHGFSTLYPHLKFAGIVLNRVGSDRHLDLLKAAIEPLDLPILGVIRRQDHIKIPDRHLGLVPAEELPELDALLGRLAALAGRCFDWERLLPLLSAESAIAHPPIGDPPPAPFIKGGAQFNKGETQFSGLRIAIARDAAFSFYYADNLDSLRELGAELVFWSPLTDAVPADIDGFYFGGGFPEVFAETLSQNRETWQNVRSLVQSGIPTYAECGGLMYLCDRIVDFQGKSWPMAGILPAEAIMEKRLTLGYYEAEVLRETPLFAAGETVRGHQFHHSQISAKSDTSPYQMCRYGSDRDRETEGWNNYPNLHASYLHLHWGDRVEIPRRFLNSCRDRKKRATR